MLTIEIHASIRFHFMRQSGLIFCDMYPFAAEYELGCIFVLYSCFAML